MKRIAWAMVAFSSAAVAWAIAIPLAPVLTASRNDGRLPRLAGSVIFVVGSVVCHQKPERSFTLAGQPLPVCARCTGIYIGAALAVLAMAGVASAAQFPVSAFDASYARRGVLAASMPTLATLVWEWTSGTMPSNAVRAAAGLPLGAAIAWIIWWSARSRRQSR